MTSTATPDPSGLPDYLRRGIRTLLAVLGAASLGLSALVAAHVLDAQAAGKVGAVLVFLSGVVAAGWNALEDNVAAFPAILKAPPSPGANPVPDPGPDPGADARAARGVTGIVVVNKSTLASSIDVQAAAAACAQQIGQHVAPAWGRLPMTVTFGTTVPPGSWPIFVFDHADQAGALGYHDETPQGQPYGKVFVVDCRKAAVALSSCLSHEVVEAFIDPACNLWADTGKHTAIAVEAGDPVEDGTYTVTVDGKLIEVSNFVLPSWFDPRATGKVDWLGQLAAPFTRTVGGYVIVEKEGKVTQQFGKAYSRTRRATKKHPAARTARRVKQGA